MVLTLYSEIEIKNSDKNSTYSKDITIRLMTNS